MNKKTISVIRATVKSLDWEVTISGDNFIFNYVPTGEDLRFEVAAEDAKELVFGVYVQYSDFDFMREICNRLEKTAPPYKEEDVLAMQDKVREYEKKIHDLYKALSIKLLH